MWKRFGVVLAGAVMAVAACGGGGASKPQGVAVDTSANALGHNTAVAHLTTKTPGDLLVAYISSDSPEKGHQTSVVTGGGLSWKLRARENVQLGGVEVWSTKLTGVVTNIPISATITLKGINEFITVVAFKNAHDIGAIKGFNAPFGTTSGSLVTTHDNVLVTGVGNDWTSSIPRTAAPDQTLMSQAIDPVGDTYWTQTGKSSVPVTGTYVVSSDTDPTQDPWNYIIAEIY